MYPIQKIDLIDIWYPVVCFSTLDDAAHIHTLVSKTWYHAVEAKFRCLPIENFIKVLEINNLRLLNIFLDAQKLKLGKNEFEKLCFQLFAIAELKKKYNHLLGPIIERLPTEDFKKLIHGKHPHSTRVLGYLIGTGIIEPIKSLDRFQNCRAFNEMDIEHVKTWFNAIENVEALILANWMYFANCSLEMAEFLTSKCNLHNDLPADMENLHRCHMRFIILRMSKKKHGPFHYNPKFTIVNAAIDKRIHSVSIGENDILQVNICGEGADQTCVQVPISIQEFSNDDLLEMIIKANDFNTAKNIISLIGNKDLKLFSLKDNLVLEFFKQNMVAFQKLDITCFGNHSLTSEIFELLEKHEEFDWCILNQTYDMDASVAEKMLKTIESNLDLLLERNEKQMQNGSELVIFQRLRIALSICFSKDKKEQYFEKLLEYPRYIEKRDPFNLLEEIGNCKLAAKYVDPIFQCHADKINNLMQNEFENVFYRMTCSHILVLQGFLKHHGNSMNLEKWHILLNTTMRGRCLVDVLVALVQTASTDFNIQLNVPQIDDYLTRCMCLPVKDGRTPSIEEMKFMLEKFTFEDKPHFLRT